jgi:hypothetical protein
MGGCFLNARGFTMHRRALAVLTGALAAGLLIAIPTAASATTSHKQLARYIPTTSNYNKPQHVDNLSYGGAKIQITNKNYLIFWEPSKLQDGSAAYVSPQYNTLLTRYITDVNGSGLYENNTQYYEIVHGKKKFIKNQVTLGGTFVDTTPYPKNSCTDPRTGSNCVTDQNITDEVTKVAKAQGWKVTTKDMFYVFTAKAEGSCANNIGIGCSFSNWCGYHYFVGKMMYANIPYANTFAGNCTTLSSFPNDADSDVTISVESHEHIEAVTDGYYPDGWNSPQGEIADLCAYNYGTKDEDGGLANQKWNGNYYIIQMEWTNKQSKCVQDGP